MLYIKILTIAIFGPQRPLAIDVPALIEIKTTAMIIEEWK